MYRFMPTRSILDKRERRQAGSPMTRPTGFTTRRKNRMVPLCRSRMSKEKRVVGGEFRKGRTLLHHHGGAGRGCGALFVHLDPSLMNRLIDPQVSPAGHPVNARAEIAGGSHSDGNAKGRTSAIFLAVSPQAPGFPSGAVAKTASPQVPRGPATTAASRTIQVHRLRGRLMGV